ncbi:MAG: tetratricopeptide repeat protein [Phycisphaerales bacterium]|nr:tetratricopeptide repeat protein [Phycisphaerales bacterium]
MKTVACRCGALLLALVMFVQDGSAQNSPSAVLTSQPATTQAMTASTDLPALVAKVKPSVVTVLVYGPEDKLLAQGSGFIAEGGKLITNHHVIAGGVRAEVRLPDGRRCPVAGVLADDEAYDVAMLAVDFGDTPVADLTVEAETPREGESIVVIGSPLGLEATVSTGIISSARSLPNSETVLQITAPISPGSSGSPVVNMSGRVVGVVKYTLERGQAMNFAAPASRLQGLKLQPPKPLQEWGVARKTDVYLCARQALRAGDIVKALELFRQAAEADPRDPEILTHLGFCYFLQGDNDAAERSFLKAIELGASDGMPYTTLGGMYLAGRPKKDLARAVEILKQGIRVDPDHVGVQSTLGYVYMELKAFDMALECFKRAVQLLPENIQIRVSLGNAYSTAGKYYEAIKEYEQATRIEPVNWDEWRLIGYVYSRLGDKEGAISAYKAAIQLEPWIWTTHTLLGDEYFSSDPSMAMECYEQAIRLRSRHGIDPSEVQTKLLSAYAASGHQDALINKHKMTIRNRPTDPHGHYFLGLLLLQTGDRGAALDEYVILKELDKNLAEGLFTAIYP